MTKLVPLTIDGIRVEVPEGTLIVNAAKKAGIDIPVFCYHPKMEAGWHVPDVPGGGRPAGDRLDDKPAGPGRKRATFHPIQSQARDCLHYSSRSGYGSLKLDNVDPHHVSFPFLFASGRLEPVKGFDNLLKMIASNPNLPKLLIAGNGSLYEDLFQLSEKLQINHRVEFLGALPNEEIISYMKSCEVYLQPSINEGFSIALLEAMYSRANVVVTPFQSAFELIENGTNGFIRPIDEFSDIIQRILTEPAFAVPIRNAANKQASNYAFDTVVQKYMNEYKTLMTPS